MSQVKWGDQPDISNVDTEISDMTVNVNSGARNIVELDLLVRPQVADVGLTLTFDMPVDTRFVGYLNVGGQLMAFAGGPQIIAGLALDADHSIHVRGVLVPVGDGPLRVMLRTNDPAGSVTALDGCNIRVS